MDKTAAIIVAGGSGTRMGSKIKKQYILLEGKEVLKYTLGAFLECESINEVVIVVSGDEIDKVEESIVGNNIYNKPIKVVAGGKERQDSVYNGLMSVGKDIEYVLVHDGARPFVSKKCIEETVLMVKKRKATVLAVPVKDTIKEVRLIKDVDGDVKEVKGTPDRSTLWSIQTPQAFNRDLLVKAYDNVRAKGLSITDDSMAVEAYGHSVFIVEGDYNNIKITTKEDLVLGEAIISRIKNNE